MDQKQYQIPEPLMQGIVNALSALPWGQIDGVMNPLRACIQAQDRPKAPEAPVDTAAAQ